MAMETVADLSKAADTITIGAERHAIIVDAAAEIGCLCELLRQHEKADWLAVRGVSARISDLAVMIAGGLEDEAHQTADLARDLRRN